MVYGAKIVPTPNTSTTSLLVMHFDITVTPTSQMYVSAPLSQVQSIAPCLQHWIIDITGWCGSWWLQLNATKSDGSVKLQQCTVCHSQTELLSSALTFYSRWSPWRLPREQAAEYVDPYDRGDADRRSLRQITDLASAWSWWHHRQCCEIADTTTLWQRSVLWSAVFNHRTTAAHQCCHEAVYGLQPTDHITDAILELHWLPICAQTQFKPCLSGTERPVTELHLWPATVHHHMTSKSVVSW